VTDSRQTGMDFGLHASRFLYAPAKPETVPLDFPVIFTQLPSNQAATWQARTLILSPPGADPRLDQDGCLWVKTELLRSAASGQDLWRTPPVILGGSLPTIPWAIPRLPSPCLTISPLILDPSLSEADLQLCDLPLLWRDSSLQWGPLFKPVDGLPSLGSADSATLAAWQSTKVLYEPLPPEPEQLPSCGHLFRAARAVSQPVNGRRLLRSRIAWLTWIRMARRNACWLIQKPWR
jgi:hypothetical protein